MTIAHPIAHAWLSTGGPPGHTTGAQNYDEFADDAEITAIIAANPTSALAVEMPHRAPESLGQSLPDALPAAVARLAAAKAAGRYAEQRDIAVVYRITAPDGITGYGLWCLVDTDQISASADEPGKVIRNEDVFLDKVRERVALARALDHLLSPVLMLATGTADELHDALVSAAGAAGAPVVTDIDQAGRRHELFPVPAGPTRDRLLALAGGAELVVADGNHRSLAAQMAALPRFLAVITTPRSVTIRPYHRLISELTVTTAELVERLTASGARVEPLSAPPGVPAGAGTVYLFAAEPDPSGDRAFAVALPPSPGAVVVDNLDHALVERVLLGEVLALDAGDKRVTYVGGDYPPEWLCGEVDAGRAALAVLIAPVTVDDFVAVNLARRKLPRKSTWFTPKARAGLVVAEIDG
jgi:uncharacterized protein (DUF1015 family)